MRLVLASFFQKNVSQLPLRQKLCLRARFASCLSESLAQGLLLPNSSSYLAHFGLNAVGVFGFLQGRTAPGLISSAWIGEPSR
ncbi:hypothetical protein SAMN05216525_101593 [Bradyrhizobium sp. Gha]|nr:hypothetical protein SAMN05216525_101593 [Bradyrhizobium sp. Gha]